METPITVALIILITFSSPIVIYTYSWWLKENSRISIKSVEPYLEEDGRYIRLTVKSLGTQDINLRSIEVNRTIMNVNRTVLKAGDEKDIIFQYYWLQGRNYMLKVTTSSGSSDQASIVTPVFSAKVDFNTTSIRKIYLYANQTGPFQLQFSYTGNVTGYSWIRIMLFAQNSYKNLERPIYVFYDPLYMPFETLARVDYLVAEAEKYGIKVVKTDWNRTADLAENRPSAIFILPNPLLNASGGKVFNSLPSYLIDPDEDGIIAEHSAYQRSILYDWEKRDGLVLVSYGSHKTPMEYIVAEDGTAYRRVDVANLADEYLLTDISAPSFAGWGLSEIALTHIGQSLGLRSWPSYWFQIEDRIAESADYYAYGCGVSKRALDFNQEWMQPVFIRVGLGGWLFYGLAEQPDEDFAKNLLLIMIHSPWDSVWLGSKAWEYDSGSIFYLVNGGRLQIEGRISTGWMRNLSVTGVSLRLVILAYSADENRYIILEQTMNYPF